MHFVDAESGQQILDPFQTEDIIKGSVTIDPDGYPLVYIGSRDDKFRVIAFDREDPEELWSLDADSVPGQLGTMIGMDHRSSLMITCSKVVKNFRVFHIIKLNRSYDPSGLATVDPELVFTAPGYDDDLLFKVGSNVSIENSVAVSENTVYFANSGGLVQGWDITDLKSGVDPERIFRYWVGDDVDASVVVDEEGFLYVGVEYERGPVSVI